MLGLGLTLKLSWVQGVKAAWMGGLSKRGAFSKTTDLIELAPILQPIILSYER